MSLESQSIPTCFDESIYQVTVHYGSTLLDDKPVRTVYIEGKREVDGGVETVNLGLIRLLTNQSLF